MPRYSTFNYGTGAVYGTSTASAFSVEPFTLLPIDYSSIVLSWQNLPDTSPISRFRIVRNQYNIPETQEDGVVIYDRLAPITEDGYIIDGVTIDGSTNKVVYFPTGKKTIPYSTTATPLPSGSIIYYGVWVLRTDTTPDPNVWELLSYASTILATDHVTILGNTDDTLAKPNLNRTRTQSTHQKVMDMFPRVFTTSDETSLGEVDETSALYTFLSGFSYTFDEILTYADLLLPNHTAENYSENLLSAKAYDVNISPDNRTSTKFQRQLLRDARYIYSRKGTIAATKTLVESMTGFNAEVFPDPSKSQLPVNLMLSNQDSTFRNGIGNWQSFNGCHLSYRNFIPTVPLTTEPLAIDTEGTGQVSIGTANSWISNGIVDPLNYGIPVSPGLTYWFSYYQRKNSGTVGTVPEISWFDIEGNLLKTTVAGSATSVTTSWARVSLSDSSPIKVSQVITALSVSSGTAKVTVTSTTGLSVGDTISITIYTPTYQPLSGKRVITAIGPGATVSFAVSYTDVSSTPVGGTLGRNQAAYAGVKVLFNNNITTNYSTVLAENAFPDNYVVLDNMQFAINNSGNPAYNEARGITISLDPNKTNYIKNPSFESATTGWSTTSATSLTTTSDVPAGLISGTKSLVTKLSTSSIVSYTTSSGDVTDGKFYTFSAYLKAVSGTPTVRMTITPKEGSTSGTANYVDVPLTTSWSRAQVTVFLPDYVDPRIAVSFAGITSSEVDVRIEAVQLESGYSATDYFDGSMYNSGAEWASTANNSLSYLFINKEQRLSRLYTDLKYYLPNNTPYIVQSLSGIEIVQGLRFAGYSS